MITPPPFPTPSPLPSVDMPSPPTAPASLETSAPKENKNLMNSPFAAMFGGVATPEEIQKFIDGCLKMVNREIRRAQERWEKNQRRMRQMMEGKLPYD